MSWFNQEQPAQSMQKEKGLGQVPLTSILDLERTVHAPSVLAL
jgi:hypothetical protein